MRIVLDANVIVSAFLSHTGTPRRLLERILDQSDLELVLSIEIIDEYSRVLHYPKIRKRLMQKNIQGILDSLSLLSHFTEINRGEEVLVSEDPDDDIYLLTAKAGFARYLISGDNHLLKLNPFGSVEILPPAAFLQKLDKL